MSFGAFIGNALTSLQKPPASKVKAVLVIEGEKEVAIKFNKLELESYIEGFQLLIRVGIKRKPGAANELTLEAGEVLLKPGMTYPIGPKPLPIQASFGLQGHVDNLPQSYWGHLTVNHLPSDESGEQFIDASFEIGWTDDKREKEMQVSCSALRVRK